MVSISPELQIKVNNTKKLITQNKLQLISEFSVKEPDKYVDYETYRKLKNIKPWIENIIHTKKDISSQQTPFAQTHDRILVVCVDFIDKPAQVPITDIRSRFFSTTGNSLKNYYIENSYGKFIPDGDVFGWYRAPNPYSYYVNEDYGRGVYPNNMVKFVEDVISIISYDTLNIDLSDFDTNNDSILNYLVIVHSGGEAAHTGDTNDIWSYAASINYRTINNYTYSYHMLVSEFISNPYDVQTIGIDCHEFGHMLGLPDLYDVSGNSYGIGFYSLMAIGSWGTDHGVTPTHLDAWSKNHLGYTSTIKNKTGLVSISNAETINVNYMYTTQYSYEYFLIENRQNVLYDINLPSNGLFIWKINESQFQNDNINCLKVALIQADSKRDLENSINYGDLGDSYPGSTLNRLFSESSNPSSILCDSTFPTNNLSIYDISDSSNIMTFNAITNSACSEPICKFAILQFNNI